MWTNYNHYNPTILPVPRNLTCMPCRIPSSAEVRRDLPSTKRKMHSEFFETSKPAKILVTEEVMANQLNGLHLSNNYTSHGAKQGPETSRPSTSGTSLLHDSLLPKLTICDELRALKDSLNILPKVLEPERPTSALILWQPPAGDLGRFLQHQIEKQKDKESEDVADIEPVPELPTEAPNTPPPVGLNMDVELENNNTEMSCAYSGFSRAI